MKEVLQDELDRIDLRFRVRPLSRPLADFLTYKRNRVAAYLHHLENDAVPDMPRPKTGTRKNRAS